MKTNYEQVMEAMIPVQLLDPKVLANIKADHERARRPSNGQYVAWDDRIKWQEEMFLQASAYHPFPKGLYDDIPEGGLSFVSALATREHVITWRIRKQVLSASNRLRILRGKGRNVERGFVQFDGPVTFTQLERRFYGAWDVIMSDTPSEILGMNSMARSASGHTVITGLGLGYLVLRCAMRPQVDRITVVEIDNAVIQQTWPRIRDLCKGKVKVMRGDAREVVRRLSGDTLLADHFDSYGWNDVYDLHLKPGQFKKVRVWG